MTDWIVSAHGAYDSLDEIVERAESRLAKVPVQLQLPEDVIDEIDRRVAAGDFADRETAVARLLRMRDELHPEDPGC